MAEITSIIQNIVLAICGVATVLIASKGLTTWRKELKGKSEYAKAKEVLKAVYRVRDAFGQVRNSFIYGFEYDEKFLDQSGHLKEEHKYEGNSQLYEDRWKYIVKAFQELEEQNLDAQVEWGSEFQNVIIPLRQCRAKLKTTIWQFLENIKEPVWDRIEINKVLYQQDENSEHGDFTREINSAVGEFENRLRPLIEK
ncbi:hypothetical protein ACFL55_00195 [Candidatus Latescibacterota bacterium]